LDKVQTIVNELAKELCILIK